MESGKIGSVNTESAWNVRARLLATKHDRNAEPSPLPRASQTSGRPAYHACVGFVESSGGEVSVGVNGFLPNRAGQGGVLQWCRRDGERG